MRQLGDEFDILLPLLFVGLLQHSVAIGWSSGWSEELLVLVTFGSILLDVRAAKDEKLREFTAVC